MSNIRTKLLAAEQKQYGSDGLNVSESKTKASSHTSTIRAKALKKLPGAILTRISSFLPPSEQQDWHILTALPVGIAGFKKLPEDMLTHISSFLPRSRIPNGHILNSVSTEFNRKPNFYGQRWAAAAYNNTYLCCTSSYSHAGRSGDPELNYAHYLNQPPEGCVIAPIRSNYLCSDNYSNCERIKYTLAFSCVEYCCADTPFRVLPQIVNHMVSSLCCGAGFFAGTVTDKCCAPEAIQLVSPEEARNPSPVRQIMS